MNGWMDCSFQHGFVSLIFFDKVCVTDIWSTFQVCLEEDPACTSDRQVPPIGTPRGLLNSLCPFCVMWLISIQARLFAKRWVDLSTNARTKLTVLSMQMELIAKVRCPYIVEYKDSWVEKVSWSHLLLSVHMPIVRVHESNLWSCPSLHAQWSYWRINIDHQSLKWMLLLLFSGVLRVHRDRLLRGRRHVCSLWSKLWIVIWNL